jgi:hypothetical protein
MYAGSSISAAGAAKGEKTYWRKNKLKYKDNRFKRTGGKYGTYEACEKLITGLYKQLSDKAVKGVERKVAVKGLGFVYGGTVTYGYYAHYSEKKAMEEYLRTFGPKAPMIGFPYMWRAVEAVKNGAKVPEKMPEVPAEKTVGGWLKKRKIVDLRHNPTAAEVITDGAITRWDARRLGITRVEKLWDLARRNSITGGEVTKKDRFITRAGIQKQIDQALLDERKAREGKAKK